MNMLITITLGFLVVSSNSMPCPNQNLDKFQNDTCLECEKIVDIISYEVDYANKSLNYIIKLVKDICDVSGPIVKPQCDKVLDNISNIIIMITKGFNSTKICKAFKFCPSKIISSNNDTCSVCEIITNSIRQDIKLGNTTFNNILILIKDICDIVHAPIVSKQCVNTINSIEKIESLIMQGLSDLQICSILHMCKNQLNSVLVSI